MAKNIVEKIIAHNMDQNSRVNVNTFLINDAIEMNALMSLYKNEIFNKNLEWVVSIDHNVPSNSVEFTKKHNIMKCVSQKASGKFFYGEGIGQNLLIEKKNITGMVITSTEKRSSILGAIGALVIPVKDKEEVINIARSGKIDLAGVKVYSYELINNLSEGVSIKDVILYLIRNYKVTDNNVIIELKGKVIRNLSISDRINLCSYAADLGVLSIIIEFDSKCRDYLSQYGIFVDDNIRLLSDDNCCYMRKEVIDISQVVQQLRSKICSVDRIKDKKKIGVKVDQGFIGGCSLAMDEFRDAAKLLKDKKVNDETKLLISFPTNQMYIMALNEGLVDVFIESGAIILNSGCGACCGGCQGKISGNQVMITTGNYLNNNNNEGNIYYHSTKSVIEGCITGEV